MSANPIKDLATVFDNLFLAHVGVRYPFNNGKDAKILKDLREMYSDEQLHQFMAAFFVIEDEFIQGSGFSLGCFRGCLPKVIASVAKKSKPDIRGHFPACRTNTECLALVLEDGRKRA